jgi:hypothetical protein
MKDFEEAIDRLVAGLEKKRVMSDKERRIVAYHESGHALVAKLTPGTDPGAPAIPHLKRKLLWTTLVSALIFAACYEIYVHHLVTLEGLMAPFGAR